jgi:hypothetical protein
VIILAMSGLSLSDEAPASVDGVIKKPFTSEDFLEAVATLLEK